MKGAADYWPFLRVSLSLHPNLRQSDIIGGGNIILYSCFELFFLSLIGTPWALDLPHKILYFESKSTEPHTPQPGKH